MPRNPAKNYIKYSPIESEFTIVNTYEDPRWGQVKIMENRQNHQRVLVVERRVDNEVLLTREVNHAERRLRLNNSGLLELKDYSTRKVPELCTTYYVIRYYYEEIPTDLQKEILERKKRNMGFSDQELTYILYNCVDAGKRLQENKIAHGDISPLRIGFMPNPLCTKLIDKENYNETAFQSQTVRLMSGKPIYMCDEYYGSAVKNKIAANCPEVKNDVFMLGLCLLEAGNMESVQNIYNKSGGNIVKGDLDDHLRKFSESFKVFLLIF